MKIFKALFLLLPFNVLAHPGHAEMTASMTTADFVMAAMLLSAVVMPLLFVFYKRSQKD